MGHTIIIYDALRDLASFVQSEKREKHPCPHPLTPPSPPPSWMSVYSVR